MSLESDLVPKGVVYKYLPDPRHLPPPLTQEGTDLADFSNRGVAASPPVKYDV